MNKKALGVLGIVVLASTVFSSAAFAGESLFGKLKLAEGLPKGAIEFYQTFNQRQDKSVGHYTALNTSTEIEYGVTDKFTIGGGLNGQALHTSGLLVDAYIPGDHNSAWALSGAEVDLLYNFLSPAKEVMGLSGYFGVNYATLDPHSGRAKNSFSTEFGMIVQKYFMEGQLVWAGNLGMESTIANRKAIPDLPAGFEWPTFPEVEFELITGTGLSDRIAPNWYVGGEFIYEEEHETEVGSERHSMFFGPSIHYGSQNWWVTVTYLTQLYGGGERFDGQESGLHLIEKTKNEFKVSVGCNF